MKSLRKAVHAKLKGTAKNVQAGAVKNTAKHDDPAGSGVAQPVAPKSSLSETPQSDALKISPADSISTTDRLSPKILSETPSTASRNECWDNALKDLKQYYPQTHAEFERSLQSEDFVVEKLIKDMKNRIEMDEDEKPGKSSSQWFARLKRSLPAIASVKAIAMAASRADPHQIAPYVCAGVFCAIELSLNVISTEVKQLMREITSEVFIILRKWLRKEPRVRSLLTITSTGRDANDILSELPMLYVKCLHLYFSIVLFLASSRLTKAGKKITQIDLKWKGWFEEIKLSNKNCDATMSEIEFQDKCKKEDRVVLDWISNKSVGLSHDQILFRTGVLTRYNDRAMWLFNDQLFQDWRQALDRTPGKRVVWLRSSVGTGKTTAMCRALGTLMHDQSLDDLSNGTPGGAKIARICYVYCQMIDQKAPSCETILRTLLRQLAILPDSTLSDCARSTYYKDQNDQYSGGLSLHSWQQLFHSVLSNYSQHQACIILVDALDECDGDDINKLLRILSEVVSKHSNVHLITSSQLHVQVDLFVELESLIIIEPEDKAVAEDISYFIKTEIEAQLALSEHQDCFFSLNESQDLLEQFKTYLTTNARGMFQWVRIWLAEMFPVQPIALREEAEDLLAVLRSSTADGAKLRGLAALYKVYATLYQRVRHNSVNRKYKIRAYRIMLGAREALTSASVAMAAAVNDDGKMSFPSTKKYFREVCHNFFVEIDGVMVVAHDSVRLFLQSMSTSNVGDKSNLDDFSDTVCNAELARICALILMRSDHPIWIEIGLRPKDWADRFSNPAVIEKARRPFLELPSAFREILESSDAAADGASLRERTKAAMVNAMASFWELLNHSTNISGFALYTVNWWLFHWETAITAVDNCDLHRDQLPLTSFISALKDLDRSALPGCALLQWAIFNFKFVKAELEMITSSRSELKSQLSQFLSETDYAWLGQCARSYSNESYQLNGLLSISQQAHNSTVRLNLVFPILTRRMLPSQDLTDAIHYMLATAKHPQTRTSPLTDIVKICRRQLHLRNLLGDSVLEYAVLKGETRFVENILLLENVHLDGKAGALQRAENDLLLSQDERGNTILHKIDQLQISVEMATMILRFVAGQQALLNTNSQSSDAPNRLQRLACLRNEYQDTVLHCAAANSNADALSLVTEACSDDEHIINAQNTHGLTPLASAAVSSLEPRSAFEVLLRLSSIDVNLADSYGNAPLHLLLQRTEDCDVIEEAVLTLLEHEGTQAGLQNHTGQTPIFLAAKNKYGRVVEELCGRPDVDPNVSDKMGRTPLWEAQYRGLHAEYQHASYQEWNDIANYLTKQPDIDTNPVNSEGRSPQDQFVADMLGPEGQHRLLRLTNNKKHGRHPS